MGGLCGTEPRRSSAVRRPARARPRPSLDTVSEIEKVKIELSTKLTSGGARPDENGFVSWMVGLGPRGREKRVLAYELKRHESVVGLS